MSAGGFLLSLFQKGGRVSASLIGPKKQICLDCLVPIFLDSLLMALRAYLPADVQVVIPLLILYLQPCPPGVLCAPTRLSVAQVTQLRSLDSASRGFILISRIFFLIEPTHGSQSATSFLVALPQKKHTMHHAPNSVIE